MSGAASGPEGGRPRRRLGFRVGSLMLLVLAVALVLWGHEAWRRRRAVGAMMGLIPRGVLVGVGGDGVLEDAKGSALRQAIRDVRALRGETLAVSALRSTLRRDPLGRAPEADAAAMRTYQTNKAAMAALGWLGPDARPAVPEVIRVLEGSHSSHLRAMAARTLPLIGPRDARAIEALIRALDSPPRDGVEAGAIAAAAATSLGQLAREAPVGAAVPALSRQLKHPDPIARVSAAQALAAIGPDARPAAEALIDALGDEVAVVRRLAVAALGEIATDRGQPRDEPLRVALVPVLTPRLEDEDAEARDMARQVLDRFRFLAEVRSRKEQLKALIAAEHAAQRPGMTPRELVSPR